MALLELRGRQELLARIERTGSPDGGEAAVRSSTDPLLQFVRRVDPVLREAAPVAGAEDPKRGDHRCRSR